MSDDEGLSWLQWRGLIVFAVLLAGLFVYSLFDLAFLVLGRNGTATVAEVYKESGRRGREYWKMDFKFKDSAGHERTGKLGTGSSYDGPAVGEQFEIQYLPKWLLDAPDAARPTRPFNWILFSLLL